MADKWQEKRQFERFDIHYGVDIYDESGELIEQTCLKDLSGGGICLLSQSPERYSVGQKVVVVVCLPQVDQLSFRMRGKGEVVRIGSRDESTGRACVAVLMVEPLLCERAGSE